MSAAGALSCSATLAWRSVVGSNRATRSAKAATRCAGRIGFKVHATATSNEDAVKSEEAGYKKRAEESKEAGVDEKRPPRGGEAPPPGSWSWTLNWDPIPYDKDGPVSNPTDEQLADAKMVIGSCPRSPEDVDRLIDEAGVEAIVCLQCELCHDAMKIDWEPIRARALARDVPIVRVAVRDFDRLDQAKMLPEMVRKLAAFQAMGRRTYVHCTAGINRASLTVLGYLTFVEAWELDAALRIVQENRPQANPYIVSWEIARDRLLAGRQEDIYLYTQVDGEGNSIAQGGDWIKRDLEKAHRGVIKQMFERSIQTDLNLIYAISNLTPKKEGKNGDSK